MGKIKSVKKVCIFLIILSITLLLFGCVQRQENHKDKKEIVDKKSQNSITNKQSNQLQKQKKTVENIQTRGIFPGDKAYDFSLVDREGSEIKLSDLKGKIVFLRFWATWSEQCMDEMYAIQEVYDHYKDKDVVILTTNVFAAEQMDMEAINQLIDKKNYRFPVLYDITGTVATSYKVSQFPMTYIINREGIIYDAIAGSMNKEMMIKKIEGAFNKE